MKNLVFIFVVLTFLVGCSTPLMKDSKNISKQKYDYKKILIVAKTKDELMRRTFEENVVNNLKAYDVSAVSSAVYGLNVSKDSSEEQVEELKQALLNDGFDGVILTGVIDKRLETDVISGLPTTAYYGRFRGGYGVYPVTVWSPDTVVSSTKYILQSTLYKIDLDSDNLQWIGQFKVDPRFAKSAKENYPKELVDALIKESIISTVSKAN